jgi:hypothetical protein
MVDFRGNIIRSNGGEIVWNVFSGNILDLLIAATVSVLWGTSY